VVVVKEAGNKDATKVQQQRDGAWLESNKQRVHHDAAVER
jgi:hypothetical protein